MNEHIRRCLISLAMREMPNKTITKYDYIPIRVGNIRTESVRCWRGGGTTRIAYTWGGPEGLWARVGLYLHRERLFGKLPKNRFRWDENKIYGKLFGNIKPKLHIHYSVPSGNESFNVSEIIYKNNHSNHISYPHVGTTFVSIKIRMVNNIGQIQTTE